MRELPRFLSDGRALRCQVTLSDGRQCSNEVHKTGVHHSADRQPRPIDPFDKIRNEFSGQLERLRSEVAGMRGRAAAAEAKAEGLRIALENFKADTAGHAEKISDLVLGHAGQASDIDALVSALAAHGNRIMALETQPAASNSTTEGTVK